MPTPELQEFLAKIQGGDEGICRSVCCDEMDPFLTVGASPGKRLPRKSAAGPTPCECGSTGRLPRCSPS